MRFHASQVCASAAGDYYQLFLGPEESGEDDADPFNVRGPYLMVQRPFEMFSGGRCYSESLDDNYVGELPLKLTDLSPTCLEFEIVRTNNNHVHVSFEAAGGLSSSARFGPATATEGTRPEGFALLTEHGGRCDNACGHQDSPLSFGSAYVIDLCRGLSRRAPRA